MGYMTGSPEDFKLSRVIADSISNPTNEIKYLRRTATSPVCLYDLYFNAYWMSPEEAKVLLAENPNYYFRLE